MLFIKQYKEKKVGRQLKVKLMNTADGQGYISVRKIIISNLKQAPNNFYSLQFKQLKQEMQPRGHK